MFSVPLLISNANGHYLEKHYNVQNSSVSSLAALQALRNTRNTSFVDELQEVMNNKLLHIRLDTSIFNVDNTDGGYMSQFLWSLLLLLFVITMLCVLQYAAFVFENMRQKV